MSPYGKERRAGPLLGGKHPGLLAAMWVLVPLITPFILALLFASIIDPVVDLLEARGRLRQEQRLS